MIKKLLIILLVFSTSYLVGCASVPMASPERDVKMKEFNPPSKGLSGVYIYRNSTLGGALKKSVYIDGELIGETAPMTYFYKELSPGEHTLATESEFSENYLELNTIEGKNHFIRQYIKMGVFAGGANLEAMPDEEGMKGVLECKLAQ